MAFYHLSELTLHPLTPVEDRSMLEGWVERDVVPWCLLECIDAKTK